VYPFCFDFPADINREDVCDVVLDKQTASEFESAVDRQYWYELFLDDLPMWGMVGEVLRDDAHGRMEKVNVVYCLYLRMMCTKWVARGVMSQFMLNSFLIRLITPLFIHCWSPIVFTAYIHSPKLEYWIQG
jgi:hypothetical protein